MVILQILVISAMVGLLAGGLVWVGWAVAQNLWAVRAQRKADQKQKLGASRALEALGQGDNQKYHQKGNKTDRQFYLKPRLVKMWRPCAVRISPDKPEKAVKR